MRKAQTVDVHREDGFADGLVHSVTSDVDRVIKSVIWLAVRPCARRKPVGVNSTIPMKILFTGGSSFTGSWFIRELAADGHEVTAIFRRQLDEYADDPRRQRVAMAAEVCRPVHGCSFGDERFLALIAEGGWDLLCHHAADVTNYKSPDFDAIAALANNTHNLPAVLEALKAAGCRRVLLSGSVFEGGEGAGSQGLPDFSPYGLSKALTAQVFRYYCAAPASGWASSSSPTRSAPTRSRGLPPIS